MDKIGSPAENLSTAYKPVAIYFEEADSVEYVRRDTACVYRRVDDFLTLVLDMGRRELIGFRLKGFKNFYLRSLEPVHRRLDSDFLSLVTVVERMVADIGDELFDQKRQDAYRQVHQIARMDQVELRDLPRAA